MKQETLNNVPIMLSIPKTAERTGLSQYSLRKLVSRHEIPFMRSGNRIYINNRLLLDMLNDPQQIKRLCI